MDDKEYKVKHPNVRQVEDLQKATKEDASDISKTIDFLEMLGLPKDVAYGMEPEHLATVVEHISGTNVKK